MNKLTDQLGAPNYEEALKVKNKGFKDYEEYLEAQKLGAPNREALNLTLKLQAPDYKTALEVDKRRFESYEEYLEAQKLGAATKKFFELTLKLKAPSYEEALKVQKAGFPDYPTYHQATEVGVNSYSDWQIIEKRRKTLESIAHKATRIAIKDFMTLLDFDDLPTFYQWILDRPDNILVIDGDYVKFNFSSNTSFSSSDVDDAIDRLLEEFSSLERSKQGKV